MGTRDVFSGEELAQLRAFPEIGRVEVIRHFTLTAADEAFVRKFRTGHNVLGAAVQLCALPWLGYVPDDVTAAPAAAAGRLSQRLGVPMGELREYGEREQTRTEHLRQVAAYAGWRTMDTAEWKELDEFLFARAMEHDSPKLLFRLACEFLTSSRVVRPGVILILKRVAAARYRARDETWTRVAHLLSDRRRAELDLLLVPDAYLGRTLLAWLGVGPTSSSPSAVKAELEKLAYLRRLDAHTLDLSSLPTERRRFLAGVGRRLTGQALQRREPERRYPILLTLLAPYDVLAWTAEWYFRPETLEAANAANAAIVSYHHRLPLTQTFGTGTLSSSDGQRFPVKGKSITARHLSRYFARGLGVSTYTHVSDQHSTYDTKVIVATAPESHYVLDGVLGNETDLPIHEHATDTHGVTLANFALFDLVGKQLSPRIRDLGKITLYRTGPRADFEARYPRAGALLTRRLNTDLITGMWDDLLRVAASVKGGHATAALVVGKLCSPKRQQNALTSAIKEYGALRRTLYATRYLADETYRRGISRQLNKGENLHALRRSLAYAAEGALRRRHHEQQSEQMWCLTLATNAIVCWSTEYHGLAVGALRRDGRQVDDEVLAHIWPTHHENVHFYGTHSVDIDGELAQLDADGYRPLRPAAVPAFD